jgi:hypothetical protein
MADASTVFVHAPSRASSLLQGYATLCRSELARDHGLHGVPGKYKIRTRNDLPLILPLFRRSSACLAMLRSTAPFAVLRPRGPAGFHPAQPDWRIVGRDGLSAERSQ